MNKAITDGLVLMPPPFSAGLNLWSREDGTPGSGSYQGQPNAALVSNDQDFGGCLELQKTDATQKLRSFAQTPIHGMDRLKRFGNRQIGDNQPTGGGNPLGGRQNINAQQVHKHIRAFIAVKKTIN